MSFQLAKELILCRKLVPIWAIAFTALCLTGKGSAAEKDGPQLLVPAYFYPAGAGLKAWDALLDSASKTPLVAIVNPASGPGKKVDANYMAIFTKAKKSKAIPIGYVPLGYAKRSTDEIKADVDRWLEFYPGVRGIFFDEQPSGAEHVRFAREVFAHARTKIKDAL